MCKHILINNFKLDTDLDILTQFADMTSDNQGYGAILRYKDGGITTLKSLSWTGFYIGLTKELTERPPQTLVVHHRTSTNGHGIEYSHPFEYQGHFLTHNGVVDVPGKHKTATQNDSEALLHHLIKTKYETASIQGYYSCFVLTKTDTTVLVDNMAPMYTDNRVYSSHKLADAFYPIDSQRLTLDLAGTLIGQVEIDLAPWTGYGSNVKHLSLGTGGIVSDLPPVDWDDSDLSDTALEFLDTITDSGYDWLRTSRNENELESMVEDMAANLGITLGLNDLYELVEYLQSVLNEDVPSYSQAM